MSLEAGIVGRFQTYRPLVDLVGDRVFTGTGDTETLPYVEMHRDDELEVTNTTASEITTKFVYTFVVWSNDLTEAKRIADLIDSRFKRPAFNYSGGRVLDMKRISRLPSKDDDGTWAIVLDFQTRVSEEV